MRFAELSAVGLGDLHIFAIRSNKLNRVVSIDTSGMSVMLRYLSWGLAPATW